jgi:hypothetical protein
MEDNPAVPLTSWSVKARLRYYSAGVRIGFQWSRITT